MATNGIKGLTLAAMTASGWVGSVSFPVAVLAGTVLTAPAMAQVGLPAEVIGRAPQLSPDDVTKIKEFTKAKLADFASGDIDKIKRARNELISPFASPGASVPFRIKYGQALAEANLGELARSKDAGVAINALRVAGEVASTDTLPLVLEGLSADEVSVRVAAAAALSRTMEEVAGRPPALRPESLVDAIKKAGETLPKERDARAFDAIVRALEPALRISATEYKDAKPAAIRILNARVAERLKASAFDHDPGVVETTLRVVVSFRDELSRNARSLPEQDVKDLAAFAGDVLAWASKQVSTGKVPQGSDHRGLMSQLLGASENTIYFAMAPLGAAGERTKLKEAFDENSKAGDAKVCDQIEAKVIGTDGVLCKAPFGFSPSRFK